LQPIPFFQTVGNTDMAMSTAQKVFITLITGWINHLLLSPGCHFM